MEVKLDQLNYDCTFKQFIEQLIIALKAEEIDYLFTSEVEGRHGENQPTIVMIAQSAALKVSENFGGGDDSYFDYVPDLSEQIQMLLYQIPNCPEKDALIEKWEKGIRQEYLADDNNEYIEDENELQEMIQWMRSKVIGRNHDQVLTCKNVLEAWDEFNKEDHE